MFWTSLQYLEIFCLFVSDLVSCSSFGTRMIGLSSMSYSLQVHFGGIIIAYHFWEYIFDSKSSRLRDIMVLSTFNYNYGGGLYFFRFERRVSYLEFLAFFLSSCLSDYSCFRAKDKSSCADCSKSEIISSFSPYLCFFLYLTDLKSSFYKFS